MRSCRFLPSSRRSESRFKRRLLEFFLFFLPLCTLAHRTPHRPARPEVKAWEFAGRVTSGRLTHLLGHRIGPRVRQLQHRRAARVSLTCTLSCFIEYRELRRAAHRLSPGLPAIAKEVTWRQIRAGIHWRLSSYCHSTKKNSVTI